MGTITKRRFVKPIRIGQFRIEVRDCLGFIREPVMVVRNPNGQYRTIGKTRKNK